MRWPTRWVSSRTRCRCRRRGCGSCFRTSAPKLRDDDGGWSIWHGVGMNVATHPADTRNADALIDGARSLIPALRERSAEAQAARKLPASTIADYKRLELMRCLQPTMFGGYGSDYRVFSKIVRTLAQGCGSSAWVACVHGEHSWVIGSFPEEAQHD